MTLSECRDSVAFSEGSFSVFAGLCRPTILLYINVSLWTLRSKVEDALKHNYTITQHNTTIDKAGITSSWNNTFLNLLNF